MTKVSIILPSYNHKRFLKDRLDSILNQSFEDWKLTIIDDNSIDGSIDILKKFAEENKERVANFVCNKTNSGSGFLSWMKGIELAKTEYIWIAETDDYSDINFLKESIEILEQNKTCALTFCTSVYVDDNKNILYDSINRTKELIVADDDFKIFDASVLLDKMPFGTYITNGSSVVFRNSKVKIPHEIFVSKQSSDMFLWTYLLQGKSFAFLNKKLNYFRRHEGSTTTKISKFNQESVYLEKANYLNYFNQSNKYNDFINHYIKYFVNTNKSKVFNISSILKIENVKFLRLKYIKLLFKFYINKIVKSIQ